MSKKQDTAITQEQANAEIQKWFEVIGADESTIDNDENLSPLKEIILSKIISGKVKFSEKQELIYMLQYPIDTFTEMKFKNRIIIRQSVKFTGKETFFERATKILSAYTNTPTILIDQMQDRDYNFVCGLIGFFG